MVNGISGGIMNQYGNYYTPGVSPSSSANQVGNNDLSVNGAGKAGSIECQTCKERRYIDGSDENDVSFQTPTHISPEASASAVMAHEQEHVANAREEGSKENAELLSATVRLQTAVCPECGTSYVAGGLTTTMIRYKEESPYDQGRKVAEGSLVKGQNVDEYA